jgi:Ser/Thr protein kinase RdoA (MazF antagonist)
MGLPDSFFDEFVRDFSEMFDKLPKQLIHRDPNPSNILFVGSNVSGFIDFDLAERNIRLWDVCYCATGILSEWRGVDNIHDKWLGILGGILRGYNSVNALTVEERGAVWYCIMAIEFVCAAYFGTHDEYKELADTNREMLMWIIEKRNEIENLI